MTINKRFDLIGVFFNPLKSVFNVLINNLSCWFCSTKCKMFNSTTVQFLFLTTDFCLCFHHFSTSVDFFVNSEISITFPYILFLGNCFLLLLLFMFPNASKWHRKRKCYHVARITLFSMMSVSSISVKQINKISELEYDSCVCFCMCSSTRSFVFINFLLFYSSPNFSFQKRSPIESIGLRIWMQREKNRRVNQCRPFTTVLNADRF